MKKICTKCKQEKESFEFSKDIRHRDGLQSQCIKCVNERVKIFNHTEHGKKLQYARIKRTRKIHLKEKNARNIVGLRIHRGTIIKPTICSICFKEFPINKIHGHHSDYSKPLDVIWCCPQCHNNIHKELRNKLTMIE